MVCRFIFLAACISLSMCYIQEITFYSEPAAQGDSWGFRSKHPTLADYQFMIDKIRSFCVTGWWVGCSGINYSTAQTLEAASYSGTVACGNVSISTMMSLRFLGPLDTTIPSISFYSGILGSDLWLWLWGGEEKIITTLAANNFGFLPSGVAITGRSSWTAFTNDDFTGNSTCFSTTQLHAPGINIRTTPIRSVVRGCDAKYNSSYILFDVEFGRDEKI